MKKLLLILVVLAGLVISTDAQIAIPNTLVAGTVIKSVDLNTNFQTLGTHALDRLSGGQISGNVTVDPGVTIDGLQIGTQLCPTCNVSFKNLSLVSSTNGLTVNGVNIINSAGKVPALNTTYLTSVDASGLINYLANNLAGSYAALNGAAITALTATNLSGIVPVGNLPATVAYTNLGNTFTPGQFVTGRNGFSGATLVITGGAFGTGAAAGGASLSIGNNSSGGGAPGYLTLLDRSAGVWDTFYDTTGTMRVFNSPPSETSGDLIGTVVGTQTSTLDTKILLGHDLNPQDALDRLLQTPVKHFTYKSGAYSGSTFQGIIADWSPEFAMDPDAEHPQGRSFNPVSAFGYTVQAVKALEEQNAALARRVSELERLVQHVK